MSELSERSLEWFVNTKDEPNSGKSVEGLFVCGGEELAEFALGLDILVGQVLCGMRGVWLGLIQLCLERGYIAECLCSVLFEVWLKNFRLYFTLGKIRLG